MMHEIWWSLPLTLIVFFLARRLAARFKFPLLNPLLVAMVVIIPFLLLTGDLPMSVILPAAKS